MVANETGVDYVRVVDSGSKPYINMIIHVVRSMIIAEFHSQRNSISLSHPLNRPSI